jgi:hypothetical protein
MLKKKIQLLLTLSALLIGSTLLSACGEDSPVAPPAELRSESFTYAFNEGQLLDNTDTAYNSDEAGDHPRNLSAEILIEEMENGNARVTVSLQNTLDGFTYPVHAHDAADPATTPNGTPYNETPNGNIFAGGIEGNGGTAMASNESSLTYDALINEYEGFLVVHDPTQEISTTDLTTYLVLGIFAQDLEAGDPNLRTRTFSYSFNEGQLLDDPDTAYEGDHPRDLSATIILEEKIDGTTGITVTLMNTLDGETYPVHTHDAADPGETPNGTPYEETPNQDVLTTMIEGNGGEATAMLETEFSFNRLVRDYEGFFVVHDPTQELSTTDLTTYLILGLTFRD